MAGSWLTVPPLALPVLLVGQALSRRPLPPGGPDTASVLHFVAADTAQRVLGFGSHAPSYHPQYQQVTPYYREVGLTCARFRYVAHPEDSPDFDNTAASFMGALSDAGITPILIMWYIDRHARMLAARYGRLLADHHPEGLQLLDPDGSWPAYRPDFYGEGRDGPAFSSLRVRGRPYGIADVYEPLNWQVLRAEEDAIATLVELMTAAILSYTTHGIEVPYVLCFGELDQGRILHVPPGEVFNRCVETLRRRLDGLGDKGVGAVARTDGRGDFTLREVKIVGPGGIGTFSSARYLSQFTPATVAALAGLATNAYDTSYQLVYDGGSPPFYHRTERRLDAAPYQWRVMLGGGPGQEEGRAWQRSPWNEAVRHAMSLATPEHQQALEIVASEFGNTRQQYGGTLYYPISPEGFAEQVLAGHWADKLDRTYRREELEGEGALDLYRTLADETVSETVIHAVHLFEDTLALLNHGFTTICFWQIHDPFPTSGWSLVGPNQRKRPHYQALKTLCGNVPRGAEVIRLPADKATPAIWKDDVYAAAFIHRVKGQVTVALSNTTEKTIAHWIRISSIRDQAGRPAREVRVVRAEAFGEDRSAHSSARWLGCWDKWQPVAHAGRMNPGRTDDVSRKLAASFTHDGRGKCSFRVELPPVSTLVVALRYW